MFPEEAKERGIIDKIIGVDCDLDEIIQEELTTLLFFMSKLKIS